MPLVRTLRRFWYMMTSLGHCKPNKFYRRTHDHHFRTSRSSIIANETVVDYFCICFDVQRGLPLIRHEFIHLLCVVWPSQQDVSIDMGYLSAILYIQAGFFYTPKRSQPRRGLIICMHFEFPVQMTQSELSG